MKRVLYFLSTVGSHAITDSWFSVDIHRPCGVKFDLAPQVADVDSQDVHFAFVCCPPYQPEQLAMRENLPRVLQE